MSTDLQAKYNEMRQQRGSGYQPRTHHLDAEGWARYTNRLFLESSPYLLQHAHNPVDWYPWGEEAFQKARSENLPIMISIGYATCHWCHVMEAESFEDEEIARTINANFVAIKIDREERPDVDSIYMQAVQALGQGGGWPLNVWLTPDLEPFFGGTYLPARDGDRPGATGFLTVLKALKAYYDDNRDKVDETARALAAHLETLNTTTPAGNLPDESTLHNAIDLFGKIYDPVNGGVRGAPKFPSSLPVRLLLRYYRRSGDETVLKMATTTLEKMAAGGMYDHIAGGFHRYATDAGWLVPHFEKMLYDNALLVPAYLEGFQVTRNPRFKEVAEQILDYVLKEMRSPAGVFYSATDADSIGPSGQQDEGYFFTWTPDEVRELLDDATADAVLAYYAMSDRGNFEGRNILHTPRSPQEVAEYLGLDVGQLQRQVARARAVLWETRHERARPLRDEKVLAAWNGLMISALARAGFSLDRSDYTAAAETAALSILDNMVRDGRLHRSWTAGRLGSTGFLEDYALMTAAFIDLYEATFDIAWLHKACEFDTLMTGLFADEKGGGFFASSVQHNNLIVREKSAQDNALPSGNSVAAASLLRLGAYTGRAEYHQRAEALFRAFTAGLNKSPAAFGEMLLAVETYLDVPVEIVVAGKSGRESECSELLVPLRESFLPNRVLFSGEPDTIEQGARTLPFLEGKAAIEGQAAVFVCDRNGCRQPIFTVAGVRDEITRTVTFKRPR
ncbi:MAG: thioredoxin domain-containing protein [Desulfobacterales bacterium]|nr:thioredoxin domain-containing protein [Desulfobacterales bacterium]